MDESSTFPIAQAFIRTNHTFYNIVEETMIFQYVSSCLASNNVLWNFKTNNADDYQYECAENTCRINSTRYIPYIDNICVDYRNHTYSFVLSPFAYSDPYAKSDITKVRYWYPVTVGS